MKYFCVSDVHANFDALKKALDEAGFDANNPEHHFCSLGDLLDRGKQTIECLEFVNSLPRKTLIRGNHEDLFEDVVRRQDFLSHDISNGTVQTFKDLAMNKMPKDLDSYQQTDFIINTANTNSLYRAYSRELVDFAEIGDHILVHGWIPCFLTMHGNGSIRTYSFQNDWRENGDWSRARWINGMECWHCGIKEEDKTIVCGHWHTSFGHFNYHNAETSLDNILYMFEVPKVNFDPFIDEGIVAIDASSAISNKINCYVFEVNQ